jgi:hypothetical protein
MIALKGLTKVVVCGAGALALTVASSWAIVESTEKAYWPTDIPTVVILARAERPAAEATKLARLAGTGLLQ